MPGEAERSKVAEFGMTLEGSAACWHAKHLPDSFATFDALKENSFGCSIDKSNKGNWSGNFIPPSRRSTKPYHN